MDYSLALKNNTIPKEGRNDRNQSHTNKNQINWRKNINKKLPNYLIPQLSQTIIKKAIASAYRHGITTKQGALNPATGDCAFEAVINNINFRNCYAKHLRGPANKYRLEWITKAENEQGQIECIHKNVDRKLEWKQLKQPGTYMTEISDLSLIAIARGCHKDILVFNTTEKAHSPIYVIRAEEYTGGIRNNINPVIVAYNGYHYESIEPMTDADRLRSVRLVESYKNGEYPMEKKDIKSLTLLR